MITTWDICPELRVAMYIYIYIYIYNKSKWIVVVVTEWSRYKNLNNEMYVCCFLYNMACVYTDIKYHNLKKIKISKSYFTSNLSHHIRLWNMGNKSKSCLHEILTPVTFDLACPPCAPCARRPEGYPPPLPRIDNCKNDDVSYIW